MCCDTGIMIQVTYPQNLPVSQEIEKIKQLVLQNQVVIVCGETGSGKTTQLPKMLYEMGFVDNNKIIGHTQPRVVAAKSIAHRIGEELNSHDLVGYKVRFQDRTQSSTAIKLMTDGILLQEIQSDKSLKRYSALIIDEAHERSLNIDFILGYLKTILQQRTDLKIIITSATIDNDKLSKFFNNAPVISVVGKTYPVDIIYQPLNELEEETLDLNQAIFSSIESCLEIESGNILVFLPGEREIKDCISFLRKTTLHRLQLLPLFSRQNEVEQNLIFRDDGKLKIIVTTNLAETSLTIPGIKYVIDSGLARVKRYNSRYKVEQLQIEKISQASAKQRSGRSGRLSHGLCIRLYSELDFNTRSQFTDPEILRSNLANVILRLLSFRLGEPATFPFLDRPADKAFNDGFKTLFCLNAINENEEITNIGRQISLIPVDVNLARILVSAGSQFNALSEALIIVSFLAIIDPREYPYIAQEKAKQAHQIWVDKQSDFMTVLNLWQWYKNELLHKKSHRLLHETLSKHFLSAMRMREWGELYGQLKEVVHNLKFKENTIATSYELLHQALLTGLIINIGQKDLVENYYLGTNSKKFYIHPSSAVNKAKWICSAQLMQTTKLYARMNAYILPEWIIPISKHLVKYTYSNERWEKKRGEVVVTQATLLYGLLVDRRSVAFSKLNPQLSREVFIRDGVVPNELVPNKLVPNELVPNELGKQYGFITHNQKVIHQLEKLEDKLRTALVLFEDELFTFYDKVIPYDVCDIRSFNIWCKDNEDKLKLDEKSFIEQFSQVKNSVELYPNHIISNTESIALKYIFDPSNVNDGVNALLELGQLNRLNLNAFEWLVAGLIRQKITYIIKSLPKLVRVGLNPQNNFITSFLEKADINRSFAEQLATFIEHATKINVKPSDILRIELPCYLKIHFKITDKQKIIWEGDDLSLARVFLADKLHTLVSNLSSNYEILNITSWIHPLKDLLQPTELKINNKTITGYYTLIVKDNTINFVVTDNLAKASISSKKGLLYLVKLHLTTQLKYLEQKQFNNFKPTSLLLSDIYDKNTLLNDCIMFVLRMSIDVTLFPQSGEEFSQLVMSSKDKLSSSIADFSVTIFAIATLYNQVKRTIINHPLKDIIVLQLDDLIFKDFLKYVNYDNLKNLSRYLQAILYRLNKYSNNPKKDQILEDEVMVLYNEWYDLIDNLETTHKVVPQELYDFKYKIEELRISLFAQEIKTIDKVSSKRLQRLLQILHHPLL